MASWQLLGLPSTLKKETLAIIEPVLEDTPVNTFLLKERIQRFLQSNGYYLSVISIEEKKITVVLGDPVRVGRVSFIPEDCDACRAYSLAPGMILTHNAHDESKNIIAEKIHNKSYLDASVDGKIVLSDDKKNADITISVTPGKPYSVGKIQWIQSGWDSAFLEKYLPPTNGLYYADEYKQMRKYMMSSPRFEEIRITPVKNEKVDVTIEVLNRPYAVVETGFGVASDIGPRIRLGAEIPRVSPWGAMTDISVFYGQKQQLWENSWTLPGADPRFHEWDLSARYKHRTGVDHRIRTANATVDHIFKYPGMRTTVGFTLQKDYSVFNRILYKPFNEWLIPHVQWNIQKKNYSLHFAVEGAHESVLAPINYAKVLLNADKNHLFPLFHGRIKIKAGHVFGDATSSKLLSKRFFGGGDKSIRGYKVDSISPFFTFGNQHVLIGGTSVVEASVEARTRGKLGALIFADMGDTFSDTLSLKYSVGAGGFWKTPVGNIELAWAQPLGDAQHQYGRLHFNIVSL